MRTWIIKVASKASTLVAGGVRDARGAGGAQAQRAEHRRGAGISHLSTPRLGILVMAAGASLAGCAVRSGDATTTPIHPSLSLQETPAERTTQAEERTSYSRADSTEPAQQSSSPEPTPEETALLEQASVRLNEVLARIVTLNLVTEPEGAQVTVDGCVRGRSPLLYTVFLEPGRHEIRTDLAGYMPTRHVIEMTAGETLGLTVHLRPSRTEVPPHDGCTGKGGVTCDEPCRRGVGPLMK
ncbi:PEGA domain-containing protein [Sorangium sp. So ce296]|uniref:PEGA domain-containing protein n=1 Tax=Sorangium sp. So ce296 TaxID=3133296 RepID=UPI003F5F06AB